MQSKDYYAVLGLDRNASQEEVRSAYRRRVFECHPDTNAGRRCSGDEIREVNEAYEVLGDQARRAAYDAQLRQQELQNSYEQLRRRQMQQEADYYWSQSASSSSSSRARPSQSGYLHPDFGISSLIEDVLSAMEQAQAAAENRSYRRSSLLDEFIDFFDEFERSWQAHSRFFRRF